jgi:DNA-binding response OmpR family regulator
MDAPRNSVLIVEDDDSIALAVEFLMMREGLACQRIHDGAEALGRIRADRPDLVILDVMLPGVNGYDICKGVRSQQSLAHTRILMMTASGPQARGTSEAAGADGFIAKPFDPGVLRSEVRRLLQRTAG